MLGRVACLYGCVLTSRPITRLVTPLVPITCTRGFAKPAAKDNKNKENKSKDAKGKDPKTGERKVRKPRVKKIKTPIDETKPRLHRVFNVPQSSEREIPSITRQQLQELMSSKEKFVLVDLRTEAEILLAGDSLIPSAKRMPIEPLTHLDTFKPPKAKVEKAVKGKKGKKAPKHTPKAQQAKPEPAKVDPLQRDLFLSSYKMTPAMWEAKFKFPKIDFEDNVVFFSSSNVRSSAIVNSAMKLGFKNVKILHGGSREWNKYYNILGQ